MSRGSLTESRSPRDEEIEVALPVRIRVDTAGHARRTAKRRVLGVVRRGRQFGARGVREAEWKSKGLKQTRPSGRHK